jgi:hypothetical protein
MKYRFFYHYYRQFDCMTVHFKKKCYKVQDVITQVPTETKRRKSQPRLIIQGFCKEVEFVGDTAIIK